VSNIFVFPVQPSVFPAARLRKFHTVAFFESISRKKRTLSNPMMCPSWDGRSSRVDSSDRTVMVQSCVACTKKEIVGLSVLGSPMIPMMGISNNYQWHIFCSVYAGWFC
jgi:hypothetical protein